MRREKEGIVDKGTWAVTVSSEVPTGANVLNGRFVVTIKDVGTRKRSTRLDTLYKVTETKRRHPWCTTTPLQGSNRPDCSSA
jgi:hypothetical protein